MEWVEIPAQRVLRVGYDELEEHFYRVGPNGGPPERGEMAVAIVRRRDERVFRRAAIQPDSSDMGAICYLTDI